MDKRERPASDVLEGVVRENGADYLTVGEIKLALHERGFGILLLIFSLPLSVPWPAPPGFTAIPSIPLILFSFQMMMGLDSPWLPAWIQKKRLKRTTLAVLIEKASPYLRKIERLLRPRFSFSSYPAGEKFVGFMCLLFALSIALPIPLTNFIPAIGITVVSLGLLSKDGVTMSLGMLIGVVGVTISVMVILLGKEAVVAIFQGLFG